MRQTRLGFNNCHKKAYICVEDGPWWTHIIPGMSMWLCGLMPRWKEHWWHRRVDDPVCQFCWRRQKQVVLPYDYEKLREALEETRSEY